MKYTFKTKSSGEAKILMAASDNYILLWELKRNFWRKWKHAEGSEEYFKGVYEVLDALKEELKEFNDENN